MLNRKTFENDFQRDYILFYSIFEPRSKEKKTIFTLFLSIKNKNSFGTLVHTLCIKDGKIISHRYKEISQSFGNFYSKARQQAFCKDKYYDNILELESNQEDMDKLECIDPLLRKIFIEAYLTLNFPSLFKI